MRSNNNWRLYTERHAKSRSGKHEFRERIIQCYISTHEGTVFFYFVFFPPFRPRRGVNELCTPRPPNNYPTETSRRYMPRTLRVHNITPGRLICYAGWWEYTNIYMFKLSLFYRSHRLWLKTHALLLADCVFVSKKKKKTLQESVCLHLR